MAKILVEDVDPGVDEGHQRSGSGMAPAGKPAVGAARSRGGRGARSLPGRPSPAGSLGNPRDAQLLARLDGSDAGETRQLAQPRRRERPRVNLTDSRLDGEADRLEPRPVALEADEEKQRCLLERCGARHRPSGGEPGAAQALHELASPIRAGGALLELGPVEDLQAGIEPGLIDWRRTRGVGQREENDEQGRTSSQAGLPSRRNLRRHSGHPGSYSVMKTLNSAPDR
jgi:hypothetical protein